MAELDTVTEILDALEVFINKRPGLDVRDYGFGPDASKAYHAELRQIAKDRKRALTALAAVRNPHNPHDLATLLDSFRAFSGRLEWIPAKYVSGMSDGKPVTHDSATGEKYNVQGRLEYTTGQYFPTEYRKAAAAVLETYDAAMRSAWAKLHPRQPAPFRSIAEVKAANRAIGNHWFDPSTIRFFATRIESKLMTRGASGRQVFITSEENEPSPRKYTLREALPTGEIDTIGEFQQYLTLEDAQDAVKELS